MPMLDILYEDDILLFVNKPPGMVVQRGYDADEIILLDLVRSHAHVPVHLLQRLDRGTSGVIFFSKSSAMNVRTGPIDLITTLHGFPGTDSIPRYIDSM